MEKLNALLHADQPSPGSSFFKYFEMISKFYPQHFASFTTAGPEEGQVDAVQHQMLTHHQNLETSINSDGTLSPSQKAFLKEAMDLQRRMMVALLEADPSYL